MDTILFQSVVFGPIRSRRLGTSLGINLLPADGKWCNYDCIYCECGWNAQHPSHALPTRAVVSAALGERLTALAAEHCPPDAITFSGNGEPTLHPHFADIVDDVIALRDRHAPQTKICVLTNATNINKDAVRSALRKVDTTLLKLDAGNDRMLRLINQPQLKIGVRDLVDRMRDFGERLAIQSMFLRGTVNGIEIDNTQENEVEQWLALIEYLQPFQVMLYSIDRTTPATGLQKIEPHLLQQIAQQVRKLGITATVY